MRLSLSLKPSIPTKKKKEYKFLDPNKLISNFRIRSNSIYNAELDLKPKKMVKIFRSRK